MPNYLQLLETEIAARHSLVPKQIASSVYFGGGTPSLMPVAAIEQILRSLRAVGFTIPDDAEITIEINPGTISRQRIEEYLACGINRFSVGVQTFFDNHLDAMGREHTAKQSLADIELLRSMKVNFSLDLLFGLPKQTEQEFQTDLKFFSDSGAQHISAYNLTVPKNHPMEKGRPTDQTQAHMFERIQESLAGSGIFRYELSNYSRPGFESRHNLLYWTDGDYWGIGVSAHSFLKSEEEPLGRRFWNSPSATLYEKQVHGPLPNQQIEILKRHEALTDFCHTQLRKIVGLDLTLLRAKFGLEAEQLVRNRAKDPRMAKYLFATKHGFAMTPLGFQLANQCFLQFTFLENELS